MLVDRKHTLKKWKVISNYRCQNCKAVNSMLMFDFMQLNTKKNKNKKMCFNKPRQWWWLYCKMLGNEGVERGKIWERKWLKWFCLLREFSNVVSILYFTFTLWMMKSHWMVYVQVWMYNSGLRKNTASIVVLLSYPSAMILGKLLFFLICEMGK